MSFDDWYNTNYRSKLKDFASYTKCKRSWDARNDEVESLKAQLLAEKAAHEAWEQEKLREIISQKVIEEREACAKVCETYGESLNNDWNKDLGVAEDLVGITEDCAAAIRGRK